MKHSPRPNQTLCVTVQSVHSSSILCSHPQSSTLYTVPRPKKGHILPQTSLVIQVGKQRGRNLYEGRIIPIPKPQTVFAVEQGLIRDLSLPTSPPPHISHAEPLDPSDLRDLTHLPFVTIDGDRAKDFDDAIAIVNEGDQWRLFVAVADVTHFVPFAKKQHPLSTDSWARLYGNTFYFPTFALPMLPKELATSICSLLPNQDRQTLVMEACISKRGTIRSTAFSLSRIRSQARLTYEGVKACFLDGYAKAKEHLLSLPQGEAIYSMLSEGFLMREELFSRRRKAGSLSLHLNDIDYHIDSKGHLKDIKETSPHAGHSLIEECMLVANEAAATLLLANNCPFLSRIHPAPSPEKLQALATILALHAPALLPKNQRLFPADLAKLIERASQTPLASTIHRLCLRSLPKACYSPSSEGHFGLAKTHYCHATSPIRRYADVLIHRAIKRVIGVGSDPLFDHKRLAHIADHLNRQEYTAQLLERELARRLGVLFMQKAIGKDFALIVTGVHPTGLFVRLQNHPIEGRIPTCFFPANCAADCRMQCLRTRSGSLILGLGAQIWGELVSLDPLNFLLTFYPRSPWNPR
ncbi:MAG: RNB domain-containing ribonuclease [Desulfovibrio sp.]|nr:RNB domain-containing ribonuclease [Desulfovibrio sp.]